MRLWRNWQTRTFEGRVGNRMGSSPISRTKQEWALLHRAVSIIKNWLRRDLYAGLQGYVLSPGGAYGDCC